MRRADDRGELTGLDRGLLAALGGFRWVAWAWMAALVVAARDDLVRPWVAVALVTAAGAVTIGLTGLLRRRPALLLDPWVLAAELAVGAALLVGDGWAYGPDPFGASAPPSLGSVWPVTGVLATGVALGVAAGAWSGVLLGAANVAGKLIAGQPSLEEQVLSVASTAVQLSLAGGMLGFAAFRLRGAERAVAEAQAREEVARTLHDGVLQTLAVIQHRATDGALVRLARDQERELRDYLFGTGAAVGVGGALGERLREAAAWFEDAYDGHVDIVAVDDGSPALAGERADALAGAVREALANAGKHGRAHKVTIYVDAADEAGSVFCSVKDDGRGFDPATGAEGVGITRSIRQRVEDVGGRAEIDGRPGRGTEVRLWV